MRGDCANKSGGMPTAPVGRQARRLVSASVLRHAGKERLEAGRVALAPASAPPQSRAPRRRAMQGRSRAGAACQPTISADEPSRA